MVSYDSVLGGWSKRAVDLAAVLVAAPIWLSAMLLAALWSKMRHPAPVFVSEPRVGYGGATFSRLRLRLEPPSAVIERLHPPGPDEAATAEDLLTIAARADGRRAKWRRALERLPQLINVLRGEMSLVGPRPLAADAIEQLKSGKRYYLSARPGVIGVSAVADADREEAGQYKMYALSWSLGLDALLMSDALKSLRDRGELWRPTVAVRPRRKPSEALARRRASA